jgi:hypothetical protein
MITQAKFDKGIALLQTHFNRELSPNAIAIWSEYLNEHLDDEQFTLALKQAIIELDFFPNAKRLVEFATASNEVHAIADWRVIIAAAITSNEQWQQEILKPLKERAHIALAAIGGLSSVALAEEWQLSKLEKQFTCLYCQSPTGMKFLPPARISQEEPEAIEEHKSTDPIDLSTKSPSIRRVLETWNLRSNGIDVPEEQAYTNTFARYRWEIDSKRLNYFLAMDTPSKQQFLNKFNFAMKNKSEWRSAVSIFDEITGYKVPRTEIDAKAIAREWLSLEETTLSFVE